MGYLDALRSGFGTANAASGLISRIQTNDKRELEARYKRADIASGSLAVCRVCKSELPGNRPEPGLICKPCEDKETAAKHPVNKALADAESGRAAGVYAPPALNDAPAAAGKPLVLPDLSKIPGLSRVRNAFVSKRKGAK